MSDILKRMAWVIRDPSMVLSKVREERRCKMIGFFHSVVPNVPWKRTGHAVDFFAGALAGEASDVRKEL